MQPRAVDAGLVSLKKNTRLDQLRWFCPEFLSELKLTHFWRSWLYNGSLYNLHFFCVKVEGWTHINSSVGMSPGKFSASTQVLSRYFCIRRYGLVRRVYWPIRKVMHCMLTFLTCSLFLALFHVRKLCKRSDCVKSPSECVRHGVYQVDFFGASCALVSMEVM